MSQELWPSDGSVIADMQLIKRSWFLWEEKFSSSAQFTFIFDSFIESQENGNKSLSFQNMLNVTYYHWLWQRHFPTQILLQK